MLSKINLQYLLSYSGLIPFIIILNIKYFSLIKEELIVDFTIYYSLIIIVFIGSINWNLDLKINNKIIFHGFFPSLFAVVIIIFNLINFNSDLIIFLLIIFIIFQLLLDYILIYSKKLNKSAFYFLRIPLSFSIIILLIFVRL